MGFDKIIIGINRTSDNSINILEKIKEKYPNVVYFESLDWMDCAGQEVSKGIQRLSYSYLTHKYTDSQTTNIMYLDIDEFWFSVNFNESIADFLNKVPEHDVLSFSWLMQQGDDEDFLPPFVNKSANPGEMVKSVISKRIVKDIYDFYAHNPRIKGKFKHINGKFEPYLYHEKTDQMSGFKPDNTHYAYVLHRVMRSESEYLSLLLRGRPSGGRIKSNRFGFKKNNNPRFSLSEISIPDNYYSGLVEFCIECQINEILEKCRKERINKINDILNVPISYIIDEFEVLIKVLHGTYLLEKLINKIELECNNADTLRDFAIMIESIDESLSLTLMKKAQKLRPTGPLINKKIKYYLKNEF